ncbi:hypothetical protein MPSEU_000183900 [Mayamaea pseudoterrestris]|nr:hypothetical protein MPSEU_000183900 [Mayamaea pseudoterrestris]
MVNFPPPPPPPPPAGRPSGSRESVPSHAPAPFPYQSHQQNPDSSTASFAPPPPPLPPTSTFSAPPQAQQYASYPQGSMGNGEILNSRPVFPPPPPPRPVPNAAGSLVHPPPTTHSAPPNAPLYPATQQSTYQNTMQQSTSMNYAMPPSNFAPPAAAMQMQTPIHPPLQHAYAPPPPPGIYNQQPQQHQPSHLMPPAPPLAPSQARPIAPPAHAASYQPAAVAARLDPSHMPRPPLCTFPQNDGPQQSLPIYYPRAAATDMQSNPVPPDASTRFAALDDGNASPNLMRCTTYAFPKDRSVWHATGDLPLGILCTPLGVHSDDFMPRPRRTIHGSDEDWQDVERVPVVACANGNLPPRCKHCSAYLNPFFGQNGKCNFCGTRNNQLLNVMNGSLSMQLGTMEYIVEGPYVTREQPVQAAVHVYALDVTCPHVLEYVSILRQVGCELHRHWTRQQQQSQELQPRIGVCLVSSVGIMLRSTDGKLNVIIPDVTENPFAPWPLYDWSFDVSAKEGLDAWTTFCDEQLEGDVRGLKERAKGKNAQGMDNFELSCGGAGLAFLADALKDSGGRGTLVSWRRPNFGVGSIPHRSSKARGKLRAEDDDVPSTPLQVQSTFRSSQDEAAATFYQRLAKSCVKNRVSLDIVMHRDPLLQHPFMDLATLGELCRVTSGKLAWIDVSTWKTQLYEELVRQIYSFSGWDVVFKLRCSDGLQIKSLICSPGTVVEELVGSPEVELTTLSSTTCLAIELDHRIGGVRKDQPFVFFQSATLYTTMSGQRRVRVSTLAVRTATTAKEVFRSVDFSTVSSVLLRRVVANLRRMEGSEDVSLRAQTRDAIYIQCVHMLAAYRKETGSMNDQLLLPSRMQTLPLFLMALLKSLMLRPGVPVRMEGAGSPLLLRPSADERSVFQFHSATTIPAFCLQLLYPRIFAIDDAALEGYGDWCASEASAEFNGFVRLPPPLYPSLEVLQDECLYLIDGGLKMYLVVGKDVAPEVKEQVHKCALGEWNPRAQNLLWQLRAFNSIGRGSESELRPTYATVSIVFQQGNHQNPLEMAVMDLMLDDAIGGQRDYNDFLIALQNSIRTYKIS